MHTSAAAPPAAEVSTWQYVRVVHSPLMWKGKEKSALKCLLRRQESAMTHSLLLLLFDPPSLAFDITLTNDGFKMHYTCIRGAPARHMTAAYVLGVYDASKATSASEQSVVGHAKHGRRFLEPLPLSSGRERQKKRTGGADLRPSRTRMSAWWRLWRVSSISHGQMCRLCAARGLSTQRTIPLLPQDCPIMLQGPARKDTLVMRL